MAPPVRHISRSVPKDPRDIPVQVNIRMTFRRRLELDEIARRFGLTLTEVINDALDRAHPPKEAKKVES